MDYASVTCCESCRFPLALYEKGPQCNSCQADFESIKGLRASPRPQSALKVFSRPIPGQPGSLEARRLEAQGQ